MCMSVAGVSRVARGRGEKNSATFKLNFFLKGTMGRRAAPAVVVVWAAVAVVAADGGRLAARASFPAAAALDAYAVLDLVRSTRVSNALAPAVWECFHKSARDHGDCVFGWLTSSLAPGDVVEVGCHDGKQAVEAAANGHSVATFEPDPDHARDARARIAAWRAAARAGARGSVTLAEVGLGDRPGALAFAKQGSDSHVVANDAGAWNAGATEEGRVSVNVTTLDALIEDGDLKLPNPLLLKVDTQGFDVNVLFGAHDALRRGVFPFVMTEYWPLASKRRAASNAAPALYLLAASGYRLYNLNYQDSVNAAAGLHGSAPLREALPHFASPDGGKTLFADDLAAFCLRKKLAPHPMGCSLDLFAVHESVTLDVETLFAAWARSDAPQA